MMRLGTPAGGDLFGHDECGIWDAAYVLGVLSPTERREFEAQMADCPMCRNAVGELNGMPALLAQLGRDEIAAIDRAGSGAAPLAPNELLPSLLAKVNWRRRRSRIATWVVGSAAAAVLAVGVFVDVAGPSGRSVPALSQASASVQPMAQVGTERLSSTVSLSSETWGTFIAMKCICLAPLNAHHDALAMVAVGRDGSRTRIATWVANPGETATPAGSTSTPVEQIGSVQVVSADNDQVLLERSL